MILSIVLQVIAAAFAVAMLYKLACWILFTDRIVVDASAVATYASRIKLVDGVMDTRVTSGLQFNTINHAARSYRPMPVSVNRKGGAQFSYSFWLFATDVNKLVADNAEYTLFAKGEMTPYTLAGGDGQMRVVCPRVYFAPQERSEAQWRPRLCIDYNVVQTPETQTFSVDTYRSDDNTMRHNMMSLLPNNWVMISIVFMDSVPVHDFENGMIIKVYVNDMLYDTHVDSKSLRQNHGMFYVAPGSRAPVSTRMSNLMYFNYALADAEIAKMHAAGPNLKPYTHDPNRENPMLNLSEYNKLDIYNY